MFIGSYIVTINHIVYLGNLKKQIFIKQPIKVLWIEVRFKYTHL